MRLSFPGPIFQIFLYAMPISAMLSSTKWNYKILSFKMPTFQTHFCKMQTSMLPICEALY